MSNYSEEGMTITNFIVDFVTKKKQNGKCFKLRYVTY